MNDGVTTMDFQDDPDVFPLIESLTPLGVCLSCYQMDIAIIVQEDEPMTGPLVRVPHMRREDHPGH